MIEKKSNEEEFKKTQLSLDEGEVLKFWNKNDVFKKTLEKTKEGEEFVFYDGPPFATGTPHYGHLIPGTIKDVFPRYKTMKGFHVERNWGWDCHGMPIENIVEKKHNLNSKDDIEEFGIGKFCASAEESIFTYKDVWEETIPRTGRFVDMEKHYKTMDSNYTESVWWGFSEFAKKGLVKKDFKSMHICPRCETTLSNRDVSEGYKDIKDLSVIAKFKLLGEENTFVLAWTTTPWTLPGNVALAVGQDIEYVKTSNKENDDKYIFAKNLFEKIQKQAGFELKIIEEFTGKDLVGKLYEPLFDYYSKNKELENRENGWKIYQADFVTIEDGTGIVHIAPAFGEDDMQVGKDFKLPWVQHIGIDGKFKKEVVDFGDIPVRKTKFHEEVDIEIIKYLARNGKLFFKEKYTHSYPHCWRCKTPLLNYATSSWFIDVPKIKDDLVKENKKVNWIPDYIGHKRFSNWLGNARPWAISRSRYWGTPIPIWENKESGEYKIIGSIEELKEKTSNKNNYILFRHGESEANVKDILCFIVNSNGDKLTERGRKKVIVKSKVIESKFKNSKNDNGDKIDIIFSSPFGRTTETANIIKEELRFKGDIIFDNRLVETNFGKDNNGLSNDVWRKIGNAEDFTSETKIGSGESMQDVKNRMMEFFYEVENKYKGKNILVISHHMPIVMSLHSLTGKKLLEDENENDIIHIKNAEPVKFDFAIVPHNEKYELDFHRPFIDEIYFIEDGKKYEFIKDVFDTWFDSGSMSFASKHYPFENTDIFNPKKGIGYPADFISEAMEQTRGWFYVSLVIGYVLFGRSPYKNVVAHGMLMAEDGKKMSKSLKNYPPMDKILNKYGADSLRLFLLTSSIVRGDSPAFSEKGVDEVSKKIVMKMKNILSFYNMYKDKVLEDRNIEKSKNILDIWIIERTKKLISDVTNGLERYALDDAARPFFDFVDDFSTWFVRRSRDRYKGEDVDDRDYAILTTKWVLKNFSKIIAPFAPFLADIIWFDVRDEKESESVHLEEWPKNKIGVIEKISSVIKKDDILEQMLELREIVSKGLEARVIAGQKVRQPLGNALVFPVSKSLLKNEQFVENIKDELNIKNIIFLTSLKDLNQELKEMYLKDEHDVERYFTDEENKEVKVVLDTEITKELAEEGDFREFLRQIQVMRKKAKMKVEDNADLKVDVMKNDKKFIENNLEELKKVAGIIRVNFSEIKEEEKTIVINDKKIKVMLIK